MQARTLTPTEKGGIAETAIASHATRIGIPVLRPIVEGLRYDLAFDVGDRVLRVQCKWASLRDGYVQVSTRTNRHSPSRGYIAGTYSPEEVDLVAGYCAELDRVYVLPIADVAGLTMVHLRLTATRNNQATLVRWASQYELGAIAQLGERVTGSHEAEGSSPSSSTPPKAAGSGGLRRLASPADAEPCPRRGERDHEGEAVGCGSLETEPNVERGRISVDRMYERGANADLLGRHDDAAKRVAHQVGPETAPLSGPRNSEARDEPDRDRVVL